ncbi:unnamed protein product [Calicophoron daubneyi]|uniref:Phosphodiesterase n=1 Tax=Calicophoron daubneyi TaxID=300641 RepID=A0AAV2TLE9_CALDB
MGDGHCSLTADTNGETLKKFRSPNKKPLNCFSLCSPLTRNRTKSSKTRTTEHGFGVTEKYTKHNCARSRSTISRGFMGKLFTRSRSTPPEARDSNDRRTVASGDPVNHTDRTAPTALPNSSSTTPIAQCVSVTTESSSTQNLELSPALTVQSELSESTQHRASVVKSSSAILYQPVPTGPRSNSEDNDHDLRLSVERCERRLERLYGRLIWLRNTSTQTGANANIKPSHTSQSDARNRPAQSTSTTSEKDWTRAHVSETSDDNDEDLGTVEKQIVKLSRKLHHIKCQVESFSYLSWLGVIEGPQTGQVAVPGRNAPASNPQLNLIRRPDLDVRRTIGEFRRLCGSPISEKVRLELRETTFNNWPWSDAWLIRFVRQMFVDLGFVDRFDLLLSRLDLWLCDIYRRYNRVPFHNYKHAFMVTQMLYALIWCTPLTECFEQTDQMALLISGICHDLDHPGFNNAYQINAGTVLAMRYNDQSPLENHHTAMTFDILSHSEANPFEHLDTDTLKRIREGIIRFLVLLNSAVAVPQTPA